MPEESNTFDLDMESKAVEEQTTNKHLDEMDNGITAMDTTASSTTKRHDHPMACSDETVTIGSEGLLPVEETHKNLMVAKFKKQPAGKPDETSAIKDHDMSPDPETHETSTTADHAMDLTEEPVKTSTSADHGKKPTTNPVETSNTADLGKNPTGSPNDQNVFNLLGCPDNVRHVRQNILRHLLVSDRQIKPYWNLHSLEVPYQDSLTENYAPSLAAFAANSQLVDEATTILYGENTFNLSHARLALWWLRRIGPANVSKLKQLIMHFEEGPMAPFGIRIESTWYSVVLVLEAAQPQGLKFHLLALDFARWTEAIKPKGGLNPRLDTEVWEPRFGAVRTLFRFRGVGTAVVDEGEVINEYVAETLQRALVMAPGQTDQGILDVVAAIQGPVRQVYLF